RARRPPGRGGDRRPADRVADQPRRPVGARRRRGDLHRSRASGRPADGAAAVGRRAAGRGVLPRRGCGVRHAAGREPHQARHQDVRGAAARRQPRPATGRRHDGLRAVRGALMPAAIEVEKIAKRFGAFTAVNGVSFTVEPGEIFGLLGPNGAGKSTLIRMLTTLLPPTSGTARVGGFDIVARANDVRGAIGVIPQAMTSDLELTVRENLLIHAKLYGVPRERRKRIIGELLEAVELTAWADKPVKNLSGGMRRRAEIARGLVHEPRIFFLDEPTTGLDPVSRVAVWEMLQRIKSQRDLTILITTHYMDEADKLCDRIAIVDHGDLKALDSPLKLKASIPGRNVIEVSFGPMPDGWLEELRRLPHVESVAGEDHVFRLQSDNGPATTMALVDAAARQAIPVLSLSVQSTTLDDVFVHYAGRALRDALQEVNPMDRQGVMVRRQGRGVGVRGSGFSGLGVLGSGVLGFWGSGFSVLGSRFSVLGSRLRSGSQNAEPRTQNPERRTQNAEPRTQNPEPRTPEPQNPEPENARTANQNLGT